MCQFFFKFFNSKIFIMVIFLISNASDASQIAPRFPKEDFKYSCHAELTEQIKADYVVAFTDFAFDRDAMSNRESFSKEFSKSDWILTPYFQKQGSSLPKNTNGSVSFNFGVETNPKAEDRIFTIGHIWSGKLAYARSEGSASFSGRGELGVMIQVRTPSDDTSVAIRVTCERVK